MCEFNTYLHELVTQKELPGGVLHVQHKGKVVFHQAYGGFIDRNHQTHTMTTTTRFDLASLTKVVATLPSILWLVDKSTLEFDHAIQTYIPEFKHPDVTIQHALTHTTGLPADLAPAVKRDEVRDILTDITCLELLHTPGSQVQYSDLGMILLGIVVEKVSGLPLSTFSEHRLFKPWGLMNTTFNLTKADHIASTEWYENQYIQGKVHDEKALHLGGASGSAGLFSTASDVGKFGHYFLYPDTQQELSKALMKSAQTHFMQNRGQSFEVWSGHGAPLSCGRRWSEGSFGHTGFTGTSLWIDPQEELIVTFLTNMIHYGRQHNMVRIRPHLHSMIHAYFTNQ
ncbi:serine hydrolase domain-containing protein [Pseudalkalibacillus hwajinpoensis]|uniref:serine hydrolase domain-containing protein n=1 Tax=Guptibacillus hwajinpoensis TaxID=208199 RepID=UPI00325BEA1B